MSNLVNDIVEGVVKAFEDGNEAELTAVIIVAAQRERRDRIATAVLAGLAANHGLYRAYSGSGTEQVLCIDDVSIRNLALAETDRLIAELDKEPEPK